MPTLEEIKNDPEFYKLAPQVKRRILEEVDPEFKDLPDSTKTKVVQSLQPQGQPIRPEDFAGPSQATPFQPGMTVTEAEGMRAGGLITEDVLRAAAPSAGGMAGGAIGAAGGQAFPVVGTAPGAVWGAAKGGGLGRLAVEAYDQLTGHPDASKSIDEALVRLGETSTTEAVAEAVGLGIAFGASKTIKPLFGKVSAKTKEMIKRMKKKDPSLFLTAGEATEGSLTKMFEEAFTVVGSKEKRARKIATWADDIIEANGDNPVVLGELLYDAVKGNKTAWKEVARNEYESFITDIERMNIIQKVQKKIVPGQAPDESPFRAKYVHEMKPEVVEVLFQRKKDIPLTGQADMTVYSMHRNKGKTTQEAYKLASDAGKKTRKIMEEGGVLERAEVFKAKIDTSGVKNIAEEVKKLADELGGSMGEEADQLIKRVLAFEGNEVSFRAAQAFRSELLEKRDQLIPLFGKKGKAVKLMSEMIKEIDGKIKNKLQIVDKYMLDEHGIEYHAVRDWRRMNANYKANSFIFNKEIITKILLKGDPTNKGYSPEMIRQLLVRKDASTNVGLLKKTIFSEVGSNITKAQANEAWSTFQAQVLNHVVKKSTTEKGLLMGQKIHANMYGSRGLGNEVIQKVFTKEQQGNVKNMYDLLAQIQNKAPGAGDIGFKIAIMSGLPLGYSLSTEDTDAGTAIALAMTPWVFSRLALRSKLGSATTRHLLGAAQSKTLHRGMAHAASFGREVFKMIDDDKERQGRK